MKPTASQIAHELQGTCDSLAERLAYYDAEELENDTSFCAELDALVFCCETCGWWCEQSEMADDPLDRWICEDCAGDE